LSKALRKVGFRFVGPTTAYAAMESLGVVNDHRSGCSARRACDEERRALTLP
jgi:DNA-3-methyladenine glycosylase I